MFKALLALTLVTLLQTERSVARKAGGLKQQSNFAGNMVVNQGHLVTPLFNDLRRIATDQSQCIEPLRVRCYNMPTAQY